MPDIFYIFPVWFAVYSGFVKTEFILVSIAFWDCLFILTTQTDVTWFVLVCFSSDAYTHTSIKHINN